MTKIGIKAHGKERNGNHILTFIHIHILYLNHFHFMVFSRVLDFSCRFFFLCVYLLKNRSVLRLWPRRCNAPNQSLFNMFREPLSIYITCLHRFTHVYTRRHCHCSIHIVARSGLLSVNDNRLSGCFLREASNLEL